LIGLAIIVLWFLGKGLGFGLDWLIEKIKFW